MYAFITSSNLYKNNKRSHYSNVLCFRMSNKIKEFANRISGEWTNKKQATEFPSLWSHIQVCFRPLPYCFLDGYSFYVESAYDYCKDQPYKSGVMLLEEVENTIQTKNYALIGPEDFWYGSYEPSLLDELTNERLMRLPEGCDTIFEYDEKKKIFVGKTRIGKTCIIPKNNKKTYLDSTFILGENQYSSVDWGKNVENDEHVWGSTDGPFCFEKKQSFPID